MSQPLKIVIVGAGIGGLACAIASARQGFDVTVLERAEKLTPVHCGQLFRKYRRALTSHRSALVSKSRLTRHESGHNMDS